MTIKNKCVIHYPLNQNATIDALACHNFLFLSEQNFPNWFSCFINLSPNLLLLYTGTFLAKKPYYYQFYTHLLNACYKKFVCKSKVNSKDLNITLPVYIYVTCNCCKQTFFYMHSIVLYCFLTLTNNG